MEEKDIYEIITNNVAKYPLENEIFAVRTNKPLPVDNCIYVDGYIGLDAIRKNMQPKISYENTGRRVRNLETGVVGIVLREFIDTNSIQVLEKICPKVICTYNGWDILEFYGEGEE